MNNIIIGIGGNKGSGKDTVASMINYIVNTVPEDCTYIKWLKNKDISDSYFCIHITHFAESLKFLMCNLYGFTTNELNNPKYKDEYWYCFKDKEFYADDYIPSNCIKITMRELKDNSLNYFLYINNRNCAIKLRTLLQYIDTNIFRKLIDTDIWVNNTIERAIRINENYGYCLIPDVRFQNEVDTIKGINSSTGVIILVNRNIKTSDIHKSEETNFTVDYIIENNKGLAELFEQCKTVIKLIENELDKSEC